MSEFTFLEGREPRDFQSLAELPPPCVFGSSHSIETVVNYYMACVLFLFTTKLEFVSISNIIRLVKGMDFFN